MPLKSKQPETPKPSLKPQTFKRKACAQTLPIGPQVVPFCGLCLESYKVLPKRNYLGAHG